jgi:hypothetical protein
MDKNTTLLANREPQVPALLQNASPTKKCRKGIAFAATFIPLEGKVFPIMAAQSRPHKELISGPIAVLPIMQIWTEVV